MRVRLVVITGLLLLTPAAAFADVQVREFDTGGVIVSDHRGPTPGSDGTGEPGRPVYGYWKVVWAEGGFCRARRYSYDQEEARAYNYSYNREAAEANGLTYLSTCPPGAPTAPAPPSPGELARDFWDVRHLPSPTLEVVPAYAVVGKPVYLTIKGPPTADFHVPNPIGADISIAATSRYVVDWGDGSPPTTTTSQGGPWPHGDLTHVYDGDLTTATITVTQQWSATWSAPPAARGGTLDNLHTGDTLTLRVDQIQAVRNR
jgi:hypothetical protein